jgi:hypothetical protein
MQRRLVAAAAVLVVIFGIVVAYSLRPSGQQTPAPAPLRFTVNLVMVKPDMIDDWIDVQTKRTIPALKKAGVTQREVYQSAYGPLGEFISVTPLPSLADRDKPNLIERGLGAAEAKEYFNTTRKLVASQTTFVIQPIPDASIDPNPDAVYKVLVFSVNHFAPGRGPDYLNYIKNDLMPIQKQGKVKRWLVSQLIFGGDPNSYGTATFLEKFADLDAGPAAVRVLGQDGAAKLNQKMAGIVTSVERNVYIRNDALSFRARPTT